MSRTQLASSLLLLLSTLQQAFTSDTPSLRIVGGEDAEEGEFPYIVRVGTGTTLRDFVVNCDGFILTARTVMTAAHCTDGADTIVAGEYNTATRSGDEVLRRISRTVRHPLYFNVIVYIHHDLALLILDKPLPLGRGRKTKLGAARIIDQRTRQRMTIDTKLTVMGWGMTFRGGKEEIPYILQKADLTYIPPPISNPCGMLDLLCMLQDVHQKASNTGVFLAMTFGQDACYGDSGGPLVLADDPDVAVGIVSFGVGCAFLPGAYTDLAYHREWIEENQVD